MIREQQQQQQQQQQQKQQQQQQAGEEKSSCFFSELKNDGPPADDVGTWSPDGADGRRASRTNDGPPADDAEWGYGGERAARASGGAQSSGGATPCGIYMELLGNNGTTTTSMESSHFDLYGKRSWRVTISEHDVDEKRLNSMRQTAKSLPFCGVSALLSKTTIVHHSSQSTAPSLNSLQFFDQTTTNHPLQKGPQAQQHQSVRLLEAYH